MELLILDLATLGAVLAVAVLCAVGVVVLPWTDAELDQVRAAARAVPSVIRAGLAGPANPRRAAPGRSAALRGTLLARH